MTAPASILASFAQPAARLATGDASGAAMGGFEALLAMLSQSLQGAGQTAGEETPVLDPAVAEAAEADSDLAALLAGSSAWLAQAMSQAPTVAAADPATPDGAGSETKAFAPAEPPVLASMTRTDLDAVAELAGDEATPLPAAPEGVDTEALESLLPGRSFEAANASPLAWRKPIRIPMPKSC